jgi:hypothetical protein
MNTRFLDACRGLPVDRTPVWLMRQAGRYLPDYMRVREKCSFLHLCKTPELAAQVTLQPVDILGVDAAILFSDILIPLEPMGMKLDFVPGPVFEHPVRCMADVDRLRIPAMEEGVPFVMETIRLLRRELEGRVPLIGFGGAPFTLACYMVAGKGSKDFAAVKKMMYCAPEVYEALMEKVTAMLIAYLNAQITSGTQAVQLFDTWCPGDPLRQGCRDHAGACWQGRGECAGAGLAYPPGKGTGLPRPGYRGTGEPGPDGALRVEAAYRGGGEKDTGRKQRKAGPYLQSWPRHPSGHAAGECTIHGGVRPPAVGENRWLAAGG